MSDKTSIEWTTGPDGSPGATWNPVRGCSRVSEGCRNCYAERVAARFSKPGQPFHGFAKVVAPRDYLDRVGGRRDGWTGRVELVPDKLDEPLRWRKPRRIFVNSMSDLFHESLSDDAIERVFGVMALAQHHTFLVLTKRADRMLDWCRKFMQLRAHLIDTDERSFGDKRWEYGVEFPGVPLPNVWLGVSVEDQETADERIPLLLETPAAVRFVSCEPLLGPLGLSRYLGGRGDDEGGDRVSRDGDARDVRGRPWRDHLAQQGVDERQQERLITGARGVQNSEGGREPLGSPASRQHDLPESDVRLAGSAVEGRSASSRLARSAEGADPEGARNQPQERQGRGQPPGEPRDCHGFGEHDALDSRAGRAEEGQARVGEQPGEAERETSRRDQKAGAASFDAAVEDRRPLRSRPADGLDDRDRANLEARPRLDWVIVGGESGPGARYFDLTWARSTVKQCREAGVACFVKQLGAKPIFQHSDLSDEQFTTLDASEDGYGGEKVHPPMRSRKGGDMAEWPADLRVREFPR